MLENWILFLQGFKKMLNDGRNSEAVLGACVEQMNKTFNLEFLGSRLSYHSTDVPTSTSLAEKLAHLFTVMIW